MRALKSRKVPEGIPLTSRIDIKDFLARVHFVSFVSLSLLQFFNCANNGSISSSKAMSLEISSSSERATFVPLGSPVIAVIAVDDTNSARKNVRKEVNFDMVCLFAL